MPRLLLSSLLLALALPSLRPLHAQVQPVVAPKPPSLPATAEQNWRIKSFRLKQPTTLYDTWKTDRRVIAQLPRGSAVSGIRKLTVVYRPDTILITAPIPQLGLNTGDTIQRYAYEGEGFADFWIKGRWYKEYDGSFITEAGGLGGCSKNCTAKVTETGRKEEWSEVLLPNAHHAWFRDY